MHFALDTLIALRDYLRMFDTDPNPQDTADEAPDPAVPRAERRLRLLEELAEIGMRLARALDPDAPANKASDASADPAAQPNDRDPAAAFARVSRAIRLTLSLEARTDQQLRDLKAGVVVAGKVEVVRRETEQKPAPAAESWRAPTKEFTQALRQRVFEVIDTEAENEEDFARLCKSLDERLEEDEIFRSWEYVNLRDFVWNTCNAIGVQPDWSRWANGDWTHDGPPDRRRDSASRGPRPTHQLE